MKRISILLLAMLFVWSCSKDNQVSNQINGKSVKNIELRQSEDYQIDNFDPPRTFEDLVDCYNQFVKEGTSTFNGKFGEEAPKRITYISEGDVSQVIPLFKGEQIDYLLWINENYYFLINRNEELDSLGVPLRPYSKIFNLSKTDFLSGNTAILENDYVIEEYNNELRLIENTRTITPNEIHSKASPNSQPCSHWEEEWLLIYYDFLGLIPPIGGDLPPDVIEFETMNEIINSVTGGACVCPLPCLVIQALNDHTDVMESAKSLVNDNYLVALYGFAYADLLEIEKEILLDYIPEGSCLFDNKCYGDTDCFVDGFFKNQVPCSEVIISNEYFGFRYVQFSVSEVILFFGCIQDFINFDDFQFDFEAELPDFLFTGTNFPFGYETQQTNIAFHLTDAIDYAIDRLNLGSGFDCDFEAFKFQLRSDILGYLNLINKKNNIWGNASSQIKFKLNFSVDVPNYVPQVVELVNDPSQKICN